MGRYLIGRLAQLLPVLFLISLIVFSVMHLLPGDPALLMLQGAEGGMASPEQLANLRASMGLDQPLPEQFWHFVTHALTGDLGTSVRFRDPVLSMVLERLPATATLAIAGLLCSLVIGIPLGMLAAMRQGGWIDAICMVFSYLGASVPVFALGLVMIWLFAFGLGWLPSAGSGSPETLVLPAVTLGLINAGLVARMTRSSMVDVLREDYMRTAAAKGVPARLMLSRHALRNAMIPVVTILGLQFGNMLAGTVVTETVFSRPGIGRLIVQAILQKDYPLVQGAVLFLAVIYVLANLLVDILYAWLDPRIRYGG